MQILVNNSACLLRGEIPSDLAEAIKERLTYRINISHDLGIIFNRMKYLRKMADSDDSEKRRKGSFGLKKAQADIDALKANEHQCWYSNGTFLTGLLDAVLDVIRQHGALVSIKDLRVIPTANSDLSWNEKPFDPRYYQKASIDAAFKHHRGVVESAVGTGKSLIAAYILNGLSTKAVFVVPSRALLGQIYNDFSGWFGKDKVQKITTKDVRSDKPLKDIRIVVVNTIAALKKTNEVKGLFKDVHALCIDEFHHASSSSYMDMLSEINHVYYRFGFTGTFLRNDEREMDMHGFLSNVLYSYSAKQAVADGFLTPSTIRVHTLAGKTKSNYQKEYESCYCGNVDFLNRIVRICGESGSQDQTLILVKNKEKSGHIIHEFLNDHGIENRYISGDDKVDVINQTISAFNRKEFPAMIGSSVIGEGVDVRSTTQMIQGQGGKSEIAVVQAMGRAVRLFEGKDHAYIDEFCFEKTKYMKKHLKIRLEIYERNFGSTIVWVD